MEILLASTNPHKLREIATILAPLDIRVIGLDALDEAPPEPVEDGGTFAENARIKATEYARATGRTCLADDSGLEVDALGGAPGVHSARYAGRGRSRDERDRANNELLLERMADVPGDRRSARFVCAMCLAAPDGTILAQERGTFEGRIGHEPRGTNGFGYDPLLIVPDRGCTSAELTPQEKNARSHRGEAARRIAADLGEVAKSQSRP